MIGDLEKLREACAEAAENHYTNMCRQLGVSASDIYSHLNAADTVRILDLTPFALPTDDATPETDALKDLYAQRNYLQKYDHRDTHALDRLWNIIGDLERQRNALQAKLAERDTEIERLKERLSNERLRGAEE